MRCTARPAYASSILFSSTFARSAGLLVAGTRVMRTSQPLASRTSLIPRQCVTSSGAMEGPMVTESKPRRPWQNTIGLRGARSTDASQQDEESKGGGRTFAPDVRLLVFGGLRAVTLVQQPIDALFILALAPPP